ncbi:MAG TPA: gamma-glutamyltransferase family protein [Methylibium sp.]|nr:gamma-glutamyltransferase family protein [Methylibium sp.]
MNPFDYSRGYPSVRVPVFARNVVATSHPLAAQAGLRMLAAGGNAVDAAVAAAAAMTIVEPCSNGLGSDAFAIVWDGQRLQGLNASGRAPAAWSPATWRARHGEKGPLRGWDSVTVPGAVSAWAALSERYGRLPFADLLAPAAEIAERGYAVPLVVAEKWAAAAQVESLVSQPGFAETFLPGGRAPRTGELFRMPAAAKALRAIAATRGEAYYRGEIAAAIVRQSRAQGGAHTLEDFAAHRPEWVDTISQRYRGVVLHEIPPNGQGIAALMAAGMCEHFDLASLPIDGTAAQHLQIEAMKLAFADTYRHVAERSAMQVTTEQMLDPAYLAGRAKLIDPKRAQDFGPGLMPRGGTIYLTAADASGMMVSLIQSNYMGFGSGVVVPEWGVSLQNRGAGFSLDDASANVVAGGKRPFHTIIPAFLSDADGSPRMSFGVMGGHMQPQGHLQTLVRMIDHRQSPQAACDAPRWRVNPDGTLNVERHMDPATVQGLVALGHRIDTLADSYMDFGAGQFIWRLGDPSVEGYVAASDPRRDGLAAGF